MTDDELECGSWNLDPRTHEVFRVVQEIHPVISKDNIAAAMTMGGIYDKLSWPHSKHTRYIIVPSVKLCASKNVETTPH
ncbi:hypothetical protein FRX31_019280 [Thalictrum thalictroides]|uniref:Uncharacterized protein n=1 Tax=Thalictrum thalictroides TaxID=46969 RepID=A0A7J6W1Z8_THATH|nr:hypothetical protein FRX31_019280 [Thalictrum thalictroides]